MTVQQRPPDEVLSSPLLRLRKRGRWSWLAVVRTAWIVLALLLLGTFVANIPFFYQFAHTGCTLPDPGECPTGLLTRGNIQALDHLHLSVIVVANFLATLTVALSVCYWVVGLLIFRRKSQEWSGLFFSFLCMLLGAGGIFGFSATPQMPGFLQFLTTGTIAIMNFVGPVFFLTFPTGRFTPRWTAIVVMTFWLSMLPFLPLVVALLPWALAVGVQVYRYVRVYDPVQRQQTKWFVFTFGVGLSFYTIYNMFGVLVPSLNASDSLYQLFNVLPWLLIWGLLLLGLSVSILRYRLWEIDVIINRTLVYGSLTVLLVGLYVGLILSIQAVVRAVTGDLSQSPLVIVASTLVIAAIFQPLRHRLQAIIDRRFYRRKYDAGKVLAAFSTMLRNEVDLDTLREHMLGVVQETMQPAHVSLWMRQPTRTARSSFQTGEPTAEEAGARKEFTGPGV